MLLLLTSLPLLFGEGFAVKDAGSPALKALETRYRVVPISVTDPAELAKGRLLLMAQPLAQPAEDLVALDQWVRGGGRMLLLADPALEWPSERALGDPLRPLPMFMDTGLLGHWGLRLDAPEQRGEARGSSAASTWYGFARDSSSAAAPSPRTGWSRIAESAKGRRSWSPTPTFWTSPTRSGRAHNLDGLLAELAVARAQVIR